MKYALDTFRVNEANSFSKLDVFVANLDRSLAIEKLESLEMIGVGFRSFYAKGHTCCAKAKIDCNTHEMMWTFLKKPNNEATSGGLMSVTLNLQNNAGFRQTTKDVHSRAYHLYHVS